MRSECPYCKNYIEHTNNAKAIVCGSCTQPFKVFVKTPEQYIEEQKIENDRVNKIILD
jgi:ribosomal protein L37AE/L43A